MKAGRKLSLSEPAGYCITVQGHLDETWAEWFSGMTITIEYNDDGLPLTVLTGMVSDQAALHGYLGKLYTLGMPLITVALRG